MKESVGNFCDNPTCSMHKVQAPEDAYYLNFTVVPDRYTIPLVEGDYQDQPFPVAQVYRRRWATMRGGSLWLCQHCEGAIALVTAHMDGRSIAATLQMFQRTTEKTVREIAEKYAERLRQITARLAQEVAMAKVDDAFRRLERPTGKVN